MFIKFQGCLLRITKRHIHSWAIGERRLTCDRNTPASQFRGLLSEKAHIADVPHPPRQNFFNTDSYAAHVSSHLSACGLYPRASPLDSSFAAMEPASSRALGIAHIVANILNRQIEHSKQVNGHHVLWLPKFALVNKLWADEVTEMIWAHLDELKPLERVKCHRRQYYAAKIRTLKVVLDPSSPPATACLSGLALPRLREVELMFYYDATLQHIPPVLTPNVRAVTVHCSPRCLSRACDYALQAIMVSLRISLTRRVSHVFIVHRTSLQQQRLDRHIHQHAIHPCNSPRFCMLSSFYADRLP